MSYDKTTVTHSNEEILLQMSESSFLIELFFQGKEYSFTREELPITFGRSSEVCEITVDSSTVSRQHCKLEVRDNQIGLSDQSTNGTHIKIGLADSILIKESFYPLASQGNISLGEPIELNAKNIIYFRISTNKQKNS